MAEKFRSLADAFVAAESALVGLCVARLMHETHFHPVALQRVEIVKALGLRASPFEHARKITGDGWNVNLFLFFGGKFQRLRFGFPRFGQLFGNRVDNGRPRAFVTFRACDAQRRRAALFHAESFEPQRAFQHGQPIEFDAFGSVNDGSGVAHGLNTSTRPRIVKIILSEPQNTFRAKNNQIRAAIIVSEHGMNLF